jgi:hypothetical protein
VNPKKVLLAPLQIMLGLIKKLSRLWIHRVLLFSITSQMFPKLRNAKLKERIFVGSQIRKIVKDPKFKEKFNHIELSAWRYFKNDFLGNINPENYEEIIKDSNITHYCKMGCRMSLKIHFLHSHI